MKSAILVILLFVCNIPVYSGILSIFPEYPAFERFRTEFSYTYYTRETSFFHGYEKEISARKISAGITRKSPAGRTYALSLTGGDIDVESRETSDMGPGIRASVSGRIGGDLVVSPLWQWHIGASAEKYSLTDFNGEDIDISALLWGVQLGVSVSRELGVLRLFSGAALFNYYERYTEEFSGDETDNFRSGFYPYAGVSLSLLRNLILQAESLFLDLTGINFSVAVAF